MNLLARRKKLHLNDPCCYNGAYKDAEHIYGPWEILDYDIHPDKVEDKLKFWKELNDYAVSQRGESARSQFKIEG
jgi:hypothetical protein